MVDVNVHPGKHEVRFRQGRLIHDFLFYSLREALSKGNKTQFTGDFKNTAKGFNAQNYAGGFTSTSNVSESSAAYSSSYQNLVDNDDLNKPLGIAVAKLKNNYLLTQNQQGLLVVELTQAREVLTQQQIKTSLAEQSKLISKPVLIPFNINLNTTTLKVNAQSWLDKNVNNLQQLGFEFAVLGENEIMVRQVPAMLNASDIKESVNEFVNLIVNKELDFSSALVEIIVNDDFSNSPTQWNALLRDLENNGLGNIQSCYHQISDKDLSSWFKK